MLLKVKLVKNLLVCAMCSSQDPLGTDESASTKPVRQKNG